MTNTKVTFDAATLADAVGKAARVAPVKGAAFDQAAGLCFEIDTRLQQALLKSTNLDVTYFHKLPVQDAKGDDAVWRVPSSMLAGLTANLPMGSGAVVNFVDPGDGAIRIKSGNVVVKLQMISGDFPKIAPFPTDTLSEANDFAQKVAQVSWACSKDNSLLAGVHIDGEHLIGCNRAAAAMVPCRVPLDQPVTVPLSAIANVLRQATDVRIGASDRVLRIMLDAESQVTARLYEGTYPDVKKVNRDNFTGTAMLPVRPLVESIQRMMVVARADRLPSIKLTFNPGLVRSLVLDLNVPDTGRIQDTLDISGTYTDPFEIWFDPMLLVPAVENSRADQVLVEFGHPEPDKSSLSPVRITDSKDYLVLLTPRQP